MAWRVFLATVLATAGVAVLARTAADYSRAVRAIHSLRALVDAVEVRDSRIVMTGRIRNNSDLTLRLDSMTVRFWLNGQPVGDGRLDFAGRPLPPGGDTDFTLTGNIDPDRLSYVRSQPEAGRTWELDGRLAGYLPFGAERFSVPLRGAWSR